MSSVTEFHRRDSFGLGDGETRDRQCRRWTLVRPGADVKLRAVERTREQSVAKPALGKFCIAVGTVVSHRVEDPGDPTHDQAVFAEVGEAAELPVAEVAEVAEFM